jgi:hypothetical protein
VALSAAARARRLLLEAGRPLEAATVYWEDLRRNRENGWALFGLRQALQAQGTSAQARLVKERFEQAWARADVTLPAARFARASSLSAPSAAWPSTSRMPLR